MYFDPQKIAFSRHESFVLRFGWLSKGFRAFEDDSNVFSSEDAVVTLGVGKNMVNSIKHWLRASKLIVLEKNIKEVTPIGKAVFSKKNGWDPFLEDEATIWLLHWLISTNPEQATSWYWFFNHYHKQEFNSNDVFSAISSFAKENIDTKFTLGSIKQDIAVLLRTYTKSKINNKNLYEDALDSPLSLLKLITYSSTTKLYQSKLDFRDNLPIGIFGYAVCDYLKKLNVSQIPIEDLIYCKDGCVAPALVFRLTENCLLSKLEEIVQMFPEDFGIDQTAGIHQFYVLKALDHIDSFDMLKFHYKSKNKFEV
jgi:hypothetical protein